MDKNGIIMLHVQIAYALLINFALKVPQTGILFSMCFLSLPQVVDNSNFSMSHGQCQWLLCGRPSSLSRCVQGGPG